MVRLLTPNTLKPNKYFCYEAIFASIEFIELEFELVGAVELLDFFTILKFKKVSF